MPDLITDFIRQNEWANLRLIAACRDLTDEQLDATVDGTYGSIRATFHHIVGAEGGYATQLGVEPAGRLRRDHPWPGWDRLAEQVTEAADALVAASANPDRVIRHEGEQEDIDAAVIIIQAYHHGTDHRSQINTILSTLGVEAPDLSSWSWGLDTDRLRPDA